MDLEELRAFLAVAETGSLLTAAKSLHMSRPTLRRRIDQLEARAGVRLLDRSRLGATLTDAGTLLATRGRLIVQEASALVASVRAVGNEPSGTLRLMLPVGLPPHFLTPLWTFIRGRYPRLTFELRFSDNPVAELLVDIDMAFHFGSKSPDGPWVSRELTRVPICLIAHADYLARRGTPKTIEDLEQHDLLAWEGPADSGRLWPRIGGGTFPTSPVVVTRHIHLIRQFALTGQGIALVPEGGLPDPHVAPGTLVRVLPDLVGGQTAIRVIVPSALSQLPRVRAMLDLLKPFLGEHGL
ncbi:MAG: LysR family transcriptional regulator [Myxococcota bacterium]